VIDHLLKQLFKNDTDQYLLEALTDFPRSTAHSCRKT